jgi:hypothetical protein
VSAASGRHGVHPGTRHPSCCSGCSLWFLANLWQTAVAGPSARNRPGIVPGLTWWFGVEPPAGIEPATPSLPWNHQEPLCEPPFSQVVLDRKGQSYGFCFDAVMRSLPSAVVGAVGVVGPQRHRGVGGRADRPAVNLHPRGEDPASRPAQMKASGPGGGRGGTRYSMSNDQPWIPPPVPGPLLSIGRSSSSASPVGASRVLTERPSANWTVSRSTSSGHGGPRCGPSSGNGQSSRPPSPRRGRFRRAVSG